MSKIVDKLSTEEMITEVKKYDLLWDPTLDAYQHKLLRSRAWRKILAVFVPHFDSLTAAEKSDTENAIRRRWKSIRTCYARELLRQRNSDPSTRGRKQYQYFDQLRFLDISSKNEPIAEEESEKEAPSPSVSFPVQKPIKNTMQSVKRKAEENIEKPAKKPTIPIRNIASENEADRMFLLSLVPDLQKVSSAVKLQLKSDIINSILKAQQQDPLGETQLHFAEENQTYPYLMAGRLLNSVSSCFKQSQQDGQEDILSSNNLGVEFVKTETAESYSSLEERGSPTGSEVCDDVLWSNN